MQLSDDILEYLAEKKMSLFDLQNAYCQCVLRKCCNNRTEAAKLLGVNISTIRLKVKRFGWTSRARSGRIKKPIRRAG